MDKKELSKLARTNMPRVNVIGRPCGGFHVEVLISGMKALLRKNMSDAVRVFRTTQAVSECLEKCGISVYEVMLDNWGIDNNFDPYQAERRNKLKRQRLERESRLAANYQVSSK